MLYFFFFSSRRRHTRLTCDWSSDVCSSDLDVKRLAASFAIGGRDLGFKEADRRAALAETLREYRREMRRLAGMRTIDVWYERLDLEALEQYRSQVKRKAVRRYDKNVAKAESKNSLRAFAKLTHQKDGELRIVS